MGKNEWLIFVVCILLMLAVKSAKACDTKTVYLPDGSVQICQVCKDAVICY